MKRLIIALLLTTCALAQMPDNPTGPAIPAGLPPTGAASGALAGTYPAPTLAYSAVNAQTGATYALLTTDGRADCSVLVTLTNANPIAVSIAAATGAGFPSGWCTTVLNSGVGTATITPATSTIEGAATLTLTTGQSARIVSNGTNYRAIRVGDAVTGASALINPNAIPKATAGVLSESALKDDGTNITTTATRTYGFGTFARTGNTAPGTGNVVWWGNPKLVVADPATLGAESLTNGALLTPGAEWAVAGDFALAANAATFTWASGAGTLTQATASQAITPGSAAQWYKFVYTVSGVTAVTPACSITSAFGDTTFGLALDMTAGVAKALYFKSAASPGNFVLSCTAASGAFTLDDLSLKNIQGGDLALSGNLTARGATFNGGSGATTVVIQAGKTQSTTDLFQVKNAAGASVFTVDPSGYTYAPIFTIRGDLASLDTDLSLKSTGGIKWSSTGYYYGAQDLSLLRKSAGLLKVGDGATGYGSVEANNITAVALATPGAPTVTSTCTGTCASTWSYTVSAKAGDGTTTLASTAGTTAVNASTLDGTHYNTITWAAVTGATAYTVRRSVSGGTPATTGALATCTSITGLSCVDNGLVGDGAAAPTANTTGRGIIGGHLLSGNDGSYDIGAQGASRFRDLYLAGGSYLTIGAYHTWLGASRIGSSADGYVTLSNNAINDFNCIRLGGQTSAFGAVCRDGAGIKIRAASNDADAPISALSFAQKGANGQAATIQQSTELLTIAAAATTDTALQIPANAIVLGVSVRVTTVIPTAATFTVIGATSSTAFQTGTNVSTAATTTDPGTKSCPYLNTAAQNIRITPNTQPGDNTGRVRVTVHYIEITPPTS